ncbi:MAG: hypothetical protein RR951_06625, partial [Ruthenibacterium sp.]
MTKKKLFVNYSLSKKKEKDSLSPLKKRNAVFFCANRRAAIGKLLLLSFCATCYFASLPSNFSLRPLKK